MSQPLYPGKETQYLLYKRLGGLGTGLDGSRKSRTHWGSNPEQSSLYWGTILIIPSWLPTGSYSMETVIRDGKFLFWKLGIMLEDVLRKNAMLYVSANPPHFEVIHNNVHWNIIRRIKVLLPTDAQHNCFKRILKCTLEELQHDSMLPTSSGSVQFELAKVMFVKTPF
jgi:hypothetical protein